MKNIFLLLLSCFALIAADAQTPFNTMDSSDINNLHAAILMHGDMWYDPSTSNMKPSNFFSTDSVEINDGGGMWISGYDGSGQLHVSAETIRRDGVDFWPGPLNGSPLTYTISQNWAKIWKVNRTEIQSFLSTGIHSITTTPQSILTWPGKGNTYAQGNGGVALTITDDMAPFVDLNGNGIYEPLLGEYPDIKGDQSLWWVWSDNGPTHTATNGQPLNVEIHCMSYGYKRGTLIDNVVYYEYTIVNHSANSYSNCRLAQWAYSVLSFGYNQPFYLSEFIGYDSTWRMGITYRGTDYQGGAGMPITGVRDSLPMSAITMIDLPGDASTAYVQPGCFNYFNTDASAYGWPTADTEFNNIMRAKDRLGTHLKDDFMGSGIPSSGYAYGSTAPDCNFVFNGDVADMTQWTECAADNNPGDRHSLLSSNDFTLNSGASQKIVVALIAADTGTGGCPNAKFNGIRTVADTAWRIYHNPLPPLSVTNSTSTDNKVTVYPNPAGSELHISYTGNTAGQPSITIYNTVGQIMPVTIATSNNDADADISKLAQGLYYVVYKNEAIQTTVKFVKE